MDLSTTYLGLKLKNPIVPSASPLSRSLDTMKRMEDAGAAAIVMYSLFEEQIAHESEELDHYLSYGTNSYAEALTYFPSPEEYHLEPDEYMKHLRRAKESLGIPIIGSLNGITAGGWLHYAKLMQEAGADALELNVYYIPADPELPATDVEDRYVDVLTAVTREVTIPVAVKLSPYFSNTAHVVKRLEAAGAKGFVLFNRFYQPDIDIEQLEIVPAVSLSTSEASRLPLRWIAILYGKIKASLAATSGIHTAGDAIKMIMAGADVTMMCSALLQQGPQHIARVLEDVQKWLLEHEYVSVLQMKGSMSQKSVADPAAFERANYMKALNQFTLLK